MVFLLQMMEKLMVFFATNDVKSIIFKQAFMKKLNFQASFYESNFYFLVKTTNYNNKILQLCKNYS